MGFRWVTLWSLSNVKHIYNYGLNGPWIYIYNIYIYIDVHDLWLLNVYLPIMIIMIIIMMFCNDIQ